jgi:hypothetical protein
VIKSGTLKPLLLLALIAVIVIALAEPIAGNMMGQGNMMDQRSMVIACPDNQTCTMMHCIMENDSMNETMMHCRMGNDSMNETMMHCMMGHHCMMGNDSMNGSCCRMEMDKNASAAQAKLDCAQFWLEQAIELHEIHLKDPSTATNQSQLKMMDQMIQAYECIVGENMTKNMTKNMTMG